MKEFLDLYPEKGPHAGTGPYTRTHAITRHVIAHAINCPDRDGCPFDATPCACWKAGCTIVTTTEPAEVVERPGLDPEDPNNWCEASRGCNQVQDGFTTIGGVRVPACVEHADPTPTHLP